MSIGTSGFFRLHSWSCFISWSVPRTSCLILHLLCAWEVTILWPCNEWNSTKAFLGFTFPSLKQTTAVICRELQCFWTCWSGLFAFCSIMWFGSSSYILWYFLNKLHVSEATRGQAKSLGSWMANHWAKWDSISVLFLSLLSYLTCPTYTTETGTPHRSGGWGWTESWLHCLDLWPIAGSSLTRRIWKVSFRVAKGRRLFSPTVLA